VVLPYTGIKVRGRDCPCSRKGSLEIWKLKRWLAYTTSKIALRSAESKLEPREKIRARRLFCQNRDYVQTMKPSLRKIGLSKILGSKKAGFFSILLVKPS